MPIATPQRRTREQRKLDRRAAILAAARWVAGSLLAGAALVAGALLLR